jgi:PKD repeat protein
VETTPDATHTYGPGTFTATLTVIDDDGASVMTSVQIDSTVNQAPVAVASATPTSGLAPLEVELSSAGSDDPDGTIVSYGWDFGDGSPVSADPNPTHTYAAGTWTATLYTIDDEGGIGTATVEIVSNLAPTAVAESDVTEGDGPLEVSFTGSNSTDPDDEVVSYEWDFGDGATSTDADPTHTYAPGIWTATLTVTDSRGATSTDTIEIDVNAVPTASITSNVTTGSAPLSVNFTGVAGDADGFFSISWDFGDGSPAVTNTLTPSHTYTSSGTYDATLTVTDDRGAVTVSNVRTITVD